MLFVNRAYTDPHQLDYEWRFDNATSYRLHKMLEKAQSVVALGCPSLAENSPAANKDFLLLERNPNSISRSLWRSQRVDLRFHVPRASNIGRFQASILDPPWYKEDSLRWILYASRITQKGGSIYFCLWPDEIRPNASAEKAEVFRILDQIGQLSDAGDVAYRPSQFESNAFKDSNFFRKGQLFCLVKKNEYSEKLPNIKQSGVTWHRFTFGRKQIAIKTNPSAADSTSAEIFKRRPFLLDTTSRRDPRIPAINFWTSDNVVAELASPKRIVRELYKLRCLSHEPSSNLHRWSELADSEMVGIDNRMNWSNWWNHSM